MRIRNRFDSAQIGSNLEEKVMLAGVGNQTQILYKTTPAARAFQRTYKTTDPSSHTTLKSNGRELLERGDLRKAAARRAKGLQGPGLVNYYIFDAAFESGRNLQITVNPEFGNSSQARKIAQKYAKAAGQVPVKLRTLANEIVVHGDGDARAMNPNDIVTFHDKKNFGPLEELLVHELGHSVERRFTDKQEKAWEEARNADTAFISLYGNTSSHEDFSETLVAYVALKTKPSEISPERIKLMEKGLANRFKFIDSLNLL